MLRKLESLTFFLAMMLAVVLEAAFVYWLFRHRLYCAASDGASDLGGNWIGMALPQGWILGALLVLGYRFSAILFPPRRWTENESQRNRRAFVRLWCLAVSLAGMEGLLFLFGTTTA